MLRYRRYRVFVAFAVVTIFALYKFGASGTAWTSQALGGESPKEPEEKGAFRSKAATPEIAEETKKFVVDIPAATASRVLVNPPPVSSITKPVQRPYSQAATTSKPLRSRPIDVSTPTITPIGLGGPENDPTEVTPEYDGTINEHGEGRVEMPSLPSTISLPHWAPHSEHFPVPSESTIQLPTGSPKPIPKIQFAFKEETAQAKVDREAKLTIIRDVFKHSWKGYKEHAWLKDELSPESGNYRNPFAGWGATLVDTLDTLWMMGLKEEFDEAVEAVNQIDFTTSPRPDIPLFETTIRYLGGLVAAYDLSELKHEVLLKKAVELAEILISAFDTPNRMPETYYYWRPSFANNGHRASNRVVLAEIGSLSVEFTRLAQLTGEPKYYDAIARITDALEEFQNNTRLPGMWPTYLDASGCKKPEYSPTLQEPIVVGDGDDDVYHPVDKVQSSASTETDAVEMVPLKLPKPIVFVDGDKGASKVKNEEPTIEASDLAKSEGGEVRSNIKRQLDEELDPVSETVHIPKTSAPPIASSTPSLSTCEEQGFMSPSNYGTEEYTLGGMSDSTYEYLPKEWLLLGGLEDKYRTMYEKSIDVVKENLLFRPMLPNSDDILFSGKLNVYSAPLDNGKTGQLEAENAHLTCFAGGMFGLGAKIYDRPEDLELAKKLTEGCVWSYNATTTGIMPEAFDAVPCDSVKECEWNETKYWEAIDPHSEYRIQAYEEQIERYHKQMEVASAEYEAAMASATTSPQEPLYEAAEASPTSAPGASQGSQEREAKDKRQLNMEESTGTPSKVQTEKEAAESEEPTRVSATPSSTLPVFPYIYSPKAPLSHKEYVQNRVQEERLPAGMVTIKSGKYILRPEAIESVWYMYRITGDNHWREVGWEMFNAVNTHTATIYGNSAIDDVTKVSPAILDEMESFWLAETLKYFYLLFAEEDLVSLDDWVLNTEAHPFRRPK